MLFNEERDKLRSDVKNQVREADHGCDVTLATTDDELAQSHQRFVHRLVFVTASNLLCDGKDQIAVTVIERRYEDSEHSFDILRKGNWPRQGGLLLKRSLEPLLVADCVAKFGAEGSLCWIHSPSDHGNWTTNRLARWLHIVRESVFVHQGKQDAPFWSMVADENPQL